MSSYLYTKRHPKKLPILKLNPKIKSIFEFYEGLFSLKSSVDVIKHINNFMKKQYVSLSNVSISIKKELGENGNFYYVITNKDNQERYICYRGVVAIEGWIDLIDHWFEIEAVNIEYIPTSSINIVKKLWFFQQKQVIYKTTYNS